LVAHGDRPVGFVDRTLGPEPVDGPDGVPPAPPGGLVLVDVEYPGVGFERDPDAVASARAVFDDEHRTARTRARVTGHLRDGL
jgi:tRNA pseudouridine38-40 synthase